MSYLILTLSFVFISGALSTSDVAVCPEGVRDGQYVADYELGCSVYYLCESLGLKTLQCPKGTLFNVRANICDQPENVQCKNDTGHLPELKLVVSIPVTNVQIITKELFNELVPVVKKLIQFTLPELLSNIADNVPEFGMVWNTLSEKIVYILDLSQRSLNTLLPKLFNDVPGLKVRKTDSHYDVFLSDELKNIFDFVRVTLLQLYQGESYNRIERSESFNTGNTTKFIPIVSIPKEPLHKAFQIFVSEFSPFLTKLVRSSLPKLLSNILTSVPEFRAIWPRIMRRVVPFVTRRVKNIRFIITNVITNIPSLKITSDETHYKIVLSEGVHDIYIFLKNLIETLCKNEGLSRSKRQVRSDPMADALSKLLSKSFSRLTELTFKALSTDILSELFWNDQGVGSLQQAFWSGMTAFSPVMTEYFNAHKSMSVYKSIPDSKIVFVNKAIVEKMVNDFKLNVKPHTRRFLLSQLPGFLHRAGNNVPNILAKTERFLPYLKSNFYILQNWFLRTANKYNVVLSMSNHTHYGFVTIAEFRQDISPALFLMARIATDFWSGEPDSLFPLIFGNDGIFSNLITQMTAREVGYFRDAVPANPAASNPANILKNQSILPIAKRVTNYKRSVHESHPSGRARIAPKNYVTQVSYMDLVW